MRPREGQVTGTAAGTELWTSSAGLQPRPGRPPLTVWPGPSCWGPPGRLLGLGLPTAPISLRASYARHQARAPAAGGGDGGEGCCGGGGGGGGKDEEELRRHLLLRRPALRRPCCPAAVGRRCIAVCEHTRVKPDRPMKDGPRPNGRGEARGQSPDLPGRYMPLGCVAACCYSAACCAACCCTVALSCHCTTACEHTGHPMKDGSPTRWSGQSSGATPRPPGEMDVAGRHARQVGD